MYVSRTFFSIVFGDADVRKNMLKIHPTWIWSSVNHFYGRICSRILISSSQVPCRLSRETRLIWWFDGIPDLAGLINMEYRWHAEIVTGLLISFVYYSTTFVILYPLVRWPGNFIINWKLYANQQEISHINLYLSL